MASISKSSDAIIVSNRRDIAGIATDSNFDALASVTMLSDAMVASNPCHIRAGDRIRIQF
jgi:hypothetical protein